MISNEWKQSIVETHHQFIESGERQQQKRRKKENGGPVQIS